MKLQSVEIEGMHNVTKKKYDMDDITYLFGENGSGKSTVLQAIQLAFLGYIPGTNKTNTAIMEHANGSQMSVKLEFDTGDTLSRTWNQVGSKITNSVDGTLNPDGLLGSMELPVFNFSEFISMTPNKLKDWFIKFLPSGSDEIDWNDELLEWSEGFRVDNDLIKKVLEKIKSFKDMDQVTRIQNLNAYLKEQQSNTKAVLQNTENSINTLIKYDESDIPLDMESLEKLKSSIECSKSQSSQIIEDLSRDRNQYLSAISNNEKINGMIQMAQSQLNGIDPERDKERKDIIVSEIADLEKKKEEISEKLNETLKEYESIKFSEKIGRLKSKIDEFIKIKNSKGICPYTSTSCETILKSIEDIDNNIDEVQEQLFNTEKEFKSYTSKMSDMNDSLAEIEKSITSYRRELESIENHETVVSSATSTIQNLEKDIIEVPKDINIEEINNKIQQENENLSNINTQLAQINANIDYNKKIDLLIEQKKTIENQFELLKIWVKKTGENGIQTDVMKKPFKSLQNSINEKLKNIYSEEVLCKFNLSNQANSFSFGLVRDGMYVPYNLLSSGEKTLFSFALLLYIIEGSDSKCPIMLIDDMLDHLDVEKVNNFFETVSKVSEVQIVMAGVQKCECKDINIIEIS